MRSRDAIRPVIQELANEQGAYIIVSSHGSTADIALRMALGARRMSILSWVFGQGAKLASIGLVAGVMGSLALTHIMSSLLFQVKATDPLTFGSMSFVLLFVALSACLLPATRAMRIDPVIALRAE